MAQKNDEIAAFRHSRQAERERIATGRAGAPGRKRERQRVPALGRAARKATRGGTPDVLLDVPELRIDLIHFDSTTSMPIVAAKANVLNLVKLNVGIDVHLSRVSST